MDKQEKLDVNIIFLKQNIHILCSIYNKLINIDNLLKLNIDETYDNNNDKNNGYNENNNDETYDNNDNNNDENNNIIKNLFIETRDILRELYYKYYTFKNPYKNVITKNKKKTYNIFEMLYNIFAINTKKKLDSIMENPPDDSYFSTIEGTYPLYIGKFLIYKITTCQQTIFYIYHKKNNVFIKSYDLRYINHFNYYEKEYEIFDIYNLPSAKIKFNGYYNKYHFTQKNINDFKDYDGDKRICVNINIIVNEASLLQLILCSKRKYISTQRLPNELYEYIYNEFLTV